MNTERILVVGINRDVHTTKRVLGEIERNNIPCEFVKWGSLVFFEGTIFVENKKIELDKFTSIFCDIPSYKLALKVSNESFYFRLYNEFHELCKLADRYNIKLPNKKFFLENPFYNKFSQSQIFANKKVSAIPTLHLADNGFKKVTRSLQQLGWSFPVVVKQSEGGMGQAVWKAENDEELKEIIKDKRNISLVYQPFIKNDCDFRVLVIGGQVLGIMKRVAKKGEWKNNFALGGSVLPFDDQQMNEFCQDVCEKLELDYVGLDVFKVGEEYKIIEANIFACFEGFEEAFPENNVASHILKILK